VIGDVMDVMENLEIWWELNTPRVVFVAKAQPSTLRHAWFQDLLD